MQVVHRMATTTMPPLTRLALLRPCETHWKPSSAHPNLLRNEGSHSRTCLASIHSEAVQKRSCLQFQENVQSWVSSSGTQNRPLSQTWRCSTGLRTQDQDGGLEAASAESLQDEGGNLNAAPAGSLSLREDQGRELEAASAGRLAQVKKEEDKYLERALRAGKGALIAELLQIFGHLLERPFGGGECVANAGGAVIERVVTDAQGLRGQEGVNDQVIFELLKVFRLLEMDMELVRAAKKEETLLKRLETAKMHCKQAFVIARSF